MNFRKLALALLVVSNFPISAWAAHLAKHVVVVSIDGGKPSVIQGLLKKSDMPNLKTIINGGTVHWSAQTIFPSITLPSHMSMTAGVGPEVHQVFWNTWEPAKGPVQFPTMFSVAKQSGLVTALFAGKEKFRHLDVPGTLDEFTLADGADQIGGKAAHYLASRRPNLTFVHFPDADSAGHKLGWGSFYQKSALKKIDKAIGEIYRAITGTRELYGNTVLIITADHGGHGLGHGTSQPDDMNIPWVAWGKGVKSKTEMKKPIVTMDTASTALWVLGAQQPASWSGKTVAEAFK